MHRFKNILVYPATLAIDDPAIASAAELATRSGASLSILVVDTPPAAVDAATVLAYHRWELEGRGALNRLTRDLAVPGVAVSPLFVEGEDVAAIICAEVALRGIDLVIKTARAGDLPRSRVFSSIATRLLRECTCPVWIVRQSRTTARPPVLAAIDPLRSADLNRVDRDVLETAAQLAKAQHAELHVATAWQPAGSSLLAHRLPESEFEEHLRICARDARDALRRFLADVDVDVPHSRVHLHRGEAATVISSVAEQLGAQTIVVGSAGRTGIQRWVMGNTVEEVLRQSPRALLGVRAASDAAPG